MLLSYCMALIKCPECGKEVSDTCEQCVHCGYIFPKEEKIETLVTLKKGTFLPLLFVFLGLWPAFIVITIVFALGINGINDDVLKAFLTFLYFAFNLPVFAIAELVLFICLIKKINRTVRNNKNAGKTIGYDENANAFVIPSAHGKMVLPAQDIAQLYGPKYLKIIYYRSHNRYSEYLGFVTREDVALLTKKLNEAKNKIVR